MSIILVENDTVLLRLAKLISAHHLVESQCRASAKPGKRSSIARAHVVVDPVRDAEGKLIGFANDPVSHREARGPDRLEKAKEALFQWQKWKPSAGLTGGIAHNFNNLLAAISGSMEHIRSLHAVLSGRLSSFLEPFAEQNCWKQRPQDEKSIEHDRQQRASS